MVKKIHNESIRDFSDQVDEFDFMVSDILESLEGFITTGKSVKKNKRLFR